MTQEAEFPIQIQVSPNTILKQLELPDAQDIFHTIDSQRPYLGKWLPFVAFTNTVEDSLKFVQSIVNVPKEEKEYVFVIHHEGKFAGLIGLKGTDKLNQKTEIGYWLSEPFQKKGIMMESVQAICHFAFEKLDMNRIQIKCAVGNTSSKNIPQKLGFTFEGIERDGELLTGGIFTDIEVYSKLKKD